MIPIFVQIILSFQNIEDDPTWTKNTLKKIISKTLKFKIRDKRGNKNKCTL